MNGARVNRSLSDAASSCATTGNPACSEPGDSVTVHLEALAATSVISLHMELRHSRSRDASHPIDVSSVLPAMVARNAKWVKGISKEMVQKMIALQTGLKC